MAGQGAETGAGGIQQYSIEIADPGWLFAGQHQGVGRQGADAVQPQAFGVAPQPLQPCTRAIHRPNLPLIAHQFGQVGALAPRCGAGIQHPLAALGCQQAGDALGGSILHAPLAFRKPRQQAQIAAASLQTQAQGQPRQRFHGEASGPQIRQQLLAGGPQRVDA